MTRKLLYLIAVTFFGALLLWFYFSYNEINCEYNSPTHAGGFVPDEKTAVKIAEAVLVPIYGEQVLEHRPFKVSIQDSIWTIEGTKNSTGMGGVPIVKLHKSNGEIVKCYHTK